jgi:uncharacterized protein VirK/YbjX
LNGRWIELVRDQKSDVSVGDFHFGSSQTKDGRFAAPGARVSESPEPGRGDQGKFWPSIWKLARQPYYWSPERLPRIVWTLARKIPTQLRVLRVLSRPSYRQFIHADPRFPLKWMALDYLARGLTVTQQADCFVHHYQRMPEVIPESVLLRVMLGQIQLVEIREGNDCFAINMGLSRPWDNEGEFSLEMEVNSKMVFVLSFTLVPGSVVQSEAREVMLISRVQGVRGCFDEIQLATKTMQDVAPPALLLAALCGIAEAFGIRAMAGINATMKPEFHFYEGEAANIHEAYDGFFAELGATKGHGGFYLSPLPPVEKPMVLIKRGHKTRTREKRKFKYQIAQRICQNFREICDYPLNLSQK